MKKLELMEHQKAALEASTGYDRCAYYHDMGLGKTFSGAEKMYQEGYVNNLIICQKSKISDWIDHIKTYYDIPVYDLAKPKQMNVYISKAGKAGERIVGVISYDSTWRRPALLELNCMCLLMDESSMIANDRSKRTKFILKLAKKASGVILLSGTPINGGYDKLWSQCQILGWDIKKSTFWDKYVEYHERRFGGWAKIKFIDGYKNIEDLKDELRLHGAQFLKAEEVLTLPKQNDIYIKCNPTTQLLKFVKTSLTTVIRTTTGVEEEIFCDNSMSKRLWMRLLCSAYHKEKLEKLRDLIESTSENIIIFYTYNDELYALKEALKGYQIYVVNGSRKESEEFKKSQGQAILLVQYQAGAMGLNLQENCHIVVYFSYTVRSELYEQSRARISRIGQKLPCYYYHLTVSESIEERIYAALQQKKEYTDELFRKDYNIENKAA